MQLPRWLLQIPAFILRFHSAVVCCRAAELLQVSERLLAGYAGKKDPNPLNVPQKVAGLGIVTWQRQLRTREGCAPDIEVSHDRPGTSQT